MNMIIHDDGHSNIIGFDALEDIDKINCKNPSFGKNRFDIIVTNPPFGAGVKSSLVFIRRKGEKEKLGKYPIFMAIAEHIGYNATGRKDPKNDLDKIRQEFKKFKSKNNF